MSANLLLNPGASGELLHSREVGVPTKSSNDVAHIQMVDMALGNTPWADPFHRARVSTPTTLFDSKLLFDAAPLDWDDSETSGSGTSTSHDTDTASVTISVGASTAGTRVRQTYRSFNYESGKSQRIIMTGTFGAGATGITRRVGLFDDNNGLFFNQEDTTMKVTRRSSTTGSPVDTDVSQSSWNLDTLDGTGPNEANPSGETLDITKSQLMIIDFAWLGLGPAKLGFVLNNKIIYVHEFITANVSTGVYMSCPNLPLRYEIINGGSGAASNLECICATVMSEGGTFATSVDKWISTGGVHVDANAADTVYAVVGVRLKAAQLKAGVYIDALNLLAETTDNYEWILYRDPTVAGTFTYSDVSNSSVQRALGATANTITGGTPIIGGWGTGAASSGEIKLAGDLWLGSAIDGTPTEIVLAARPLAANLDIQGGITIKEMT